jgi:hypothetical protein
METNPTETQITPVIADAVALHGQEIGAGSFHQPHSDSGRILSTLSALQ